MRTIQRLTTGGAATAIMVGLLVAPASAQGGSIGGSGGQYFLNDSFSGVANTVFTYGDVNDQVYVGDWDGNGTDTLAVRRGNTFYVRNSNTSGPADVVFSYGNPGDVVLVGDWDGNGTDTLAVRRGNQYFVKNDLNTGIADTVFFYGNPDDSVLVGHWSSQQPGDTLGVRRGGTYYLRYSLTSGLADTVFAYGNWNDTAFVGDWNGDGLDTLGVRRPPAPVPHYGDGTYVVGSSIPPGTYRSSAPANGSCYWERLSGFSGSLDDTIVNGWFDTPEIVTISPTDAGFSTRGCGTWVPVEATYPAAPQTTFGEGAFVVGQHIAPGTYQASGPSSSCYWERRSNFSGLLSAILANDFAGSTLVTISPTDAGFASWGCGIWSRVG